MIKDGCKEVREIQSSHPSYILPKALTKEITDNIQKASLEAHKNFIHMQNNARKILRDKKLS